MRIKFLPAIRLECLIAFAVLLLITGTSNARPKRDHLTRQEADLMRDTQQLDKRMVVLIKAADRRLAAIFNPTLKTTPADIELIGELKGTRAEFLFDLSKILDEAITNIDDVSTRDEKNPLIPRAIRLLAEASTRAISQLAPLRDKVADGPERNSLEEAIENAQAIIEAAGKLPPPSSNPKKKERGEE